jgi:hypothetical protein
MSNCVGVSTGSGLPRSAITQHGVEGGDHLAHTGFGSMAVRRDRADSDSLAFEW